jgi:hypothetical protein
MEDSELRVTFDRNIRWRTTALDLSRETGEANCSPGQTLMEIKIPGTTPLWLSELLSGCKYFPRHFPNTECVKSKI